jgi:hypothetical protein
LSWAVLRPWPGVRSPTTRGPKLVSAVSAQGCSGGKMEFDDGKYEVDDARCNDGKIYDLDFNPSFELIKKTLEN